MLNTISRITDALTAGRVILRSGLLGPLHPGKYQRMARAVRGGIDATMGVRLAAIRRPDAAGVIDELGAVSWYDLDRGADALAASLLAEGARPRSVGVLCRNHRWFVQAITAAGRLGADTVLLNTSFAAPQIRDVVEREGIDVLIHDSEFESVVGGLDTLPDPPRRILAWVDDPGDRHNIEDLVTAHLGESAPPPAEPGRIVLLTSGTTGSPKGARRPSGGSATSLVAILSAIPWRTEDKVVIAAPMFHAWGFSQTLIAATMTCTIVTTRHFDAAETLRLADTHQARGLVVVPVMIERIVDLPTSLRQRHRLPALRFVTSSGSRMRPKSILHFMDQYGDVVYNNYNATEAGMITIATPGDLRAAPETAGHPVVGTDIRILGEDGSSVPRCEVGAIYVRNDSMFDGYTSGETKGYVDGYIASGDIGHFDEAGRLFVVGRDDEMIVSGGENVFPLEVERTLQAHPAVRDAVVYGVPDRDFGERLVAFVVPDSSMDADEATLKEHVRLQLATFKVPRSVRMVEELPRNAAGKIAKHQLLADLDARGDR